MENKNNENKINVINLIEDYEKLTSDKSKEDYLKAKIKINNYIDYGTKMFIAENIINSSCLKNNNIYIDSCKRYILYIYALLANYTNLDIHENELLLQYDLLEKHGLLDIILDMIPEKEIVTFKTILDMKQNDLMTNKYEIHAFISDKINSFTDIVEGFANSINQKIDSMDNTEMNNLINSIINSLSNSK
ncbi:hypothetical protein [Clostridium sp.]|uniref:hypothetical protein n=1 Tax=Clostridium sp. TaxID=1506 RepID=UPI0032168CD3